MKYIFFKSIPVTIALVFIFTSCNNTEEPIATNKIESSEKSLFGVEHPYADTIRVYANDSTFVDVKISSNKEDVLKSHLSKYKPYLKIFNGYDDVETKSSNKDLKVDTTIVNCNNVDVISTEIVKQSDNLSDYVIGYKPKETLSKASIQKVVVYPERRYYEYKSNVHDTYFRLKLWHVTGVTLSTRYAFAYLNCWLCSWRTDQFIECATWAWGSTGLIIINPWANDGVAYTGDRKYKLAVALYSQTPYNHEVRYWTSPIPNW